MGIIGLSLKESMSKNVQAIMPLEEDKKSFEKNLTNFLTNLKLMENESEEFQKNLLKDFLQKCLPQHFINTSKRTDLAIYNGTNADSSVGILIEYKSSNNKSEMSSKERINSKAFQEIVHYYMNERIVHGNLEIKRCIITNGFNWFIIEAKEFEKHFFNNKKFADMYNKWRNSQLSSNKTDFLYSEVVSPAIDLAIDKGLIIAHFNLNDALKQGKTLAINASKLTQLYRFFTAENLLNKEIFSDSNKLNKGFYDELLYLMGLEEIKVENKKVISRLPVNKRQKGALVENIIERLNMNDVDEEKQFDNAMQLAVIWINRILFLKLLESQLITFNKDENYKFLTIELLPSFTDLYDLFFGVLAKKYDTRSEILRGKFKHVPYLNSSLFEESSLENSNDGVSIDRLRQHEIEVYPKTVLKNNDKKRKTGKIDYLTYLFEFLNAYDFSTSIKHDKQNENTLINAAVLGLIFEKINGYKDGSFYTPGRITMYMSKDAVRKAAIQKINREQGWECKDIYELEFKINNIEKAREVSRIIDNLKICDPAVGSGHFLVSVLNELIAFKSDLKLLLDDDGRSLSDVRCTVVNDELIIQDINGDNFVYHRGNLQSERIQRTIFNEKKKIIENCLFGVDINPNSVNICRLRLWIELLKHSYYMLDENNIPQLTTLPNIDINIKVGNSLIYKYNIDENLMDKSDEFLNYLNLVQEYKSTNDKKTKSKLTEMLMESKNRFRGYLITPEQLEVKKLRKELNKVSKIDLFATSEQKRKQKKKQDALLDKINIAMNNLNESNKASFYSKGLEWRMEFPEILDEFGNFVGFDLVIANPPYIYSSDDFFSTEEKKYFEKRYPLNGYQANTFGLFMELGLNILKSDGHVAMIIPNSFLTVSQYKKMRKFLLENTGDMLILNSVDKIFEDASIDNCIVRYKLGEPTEVTLAELENKQVNIISNVNPNILSEKDVINLSQFKGDNNYSQIEQIIKKIDTNSLPLQPNFCDVKVGVKVYQRGKGNPKQIEDKDEFKKWMGEKPFESKTKLNESYYPYFGGEEVTRYQLNLSDNYINYGKHLAEPRNIRLFNQPRLLLREISSPYPYTINAAYTEIEAVNNQSSKVGIDLKVDGRFLMGVLNSKVVSFWAVIKFDMLQRKTFPRFTTNQLRVLPIPNVSNIEIEYLARLVESLMESLNSGSLDTILNNEVDEYVMDLFKLTDEEKNVIREFSL